MLHKLVSSVVITIGILLSGAFPGCNCNHPPGTNKDLALSEDMAASFDIGSPVPTSDGGCSPGGDSCVSDGTCCSGHCDPIAHLCTVATCSQTGATCKQATDCCDLNCANGTCSAAQCISDGQS